MLSVNKKPTNKKLYYITCSYFLLAELTRDCDALYQDKKVG